MEIKYQLYQEAGVQEYWLVYPEQNAIHQFVLDDNGLYQLKNMYADDDKAKNTLIILEPYNNCGQSKNNCNL